MLRQPTKSLTFIGAVLLVFTASWMSASCPAATIIGDPVKLSSLTGEPDGAIVVGDKKFTQFGYTATGDMPGAGGVNVVPIQDDDGNYGIQFQGAFVDLPSSQGGSDALISYMVEVMDPRRLISDAHLAGNPSLLGTAGSISVNETFLPLGQNGEYTMKIFDDESAGQKLTDWTFFEPPVRKLSVQKDILVIATPESQTVTLSFVNQTFSQIEVPEPATLLLTFFGMVSPAGCAKRRERRRST